MHRVAVTIAEIDAPLVIVVAIASYFLARAAIAPLEAARERERRFSADAAHELRSPLDGNCSRRAGGTCGRNGAEPRYVSKRSRAARSKRRPS